MEVLKGLKMSSATFWYLLQSLGRYRLQHPLFIVTEWLTDWQTEYCNPLTHAWWGSISHYGNTKYIKKITQTWTHTPNTHTHTTYTHTHTQTNNKHFITLTLVLCAASLSARLSTATLDGAHARTLTSLRTACRMTSSRVVVLPVPGGPCTMATSGRDSVNSTLLFWLASRRPLMKEMFSRSSCHMTDHTHQAQANY